MTPDRSAPIVSPISLGVACCMVALWGCGGQPPGGTTLIETGGDQDVSAGTPCSQDGDCIFGERCVAGRCSSDVEPAEVILECESDADCPADHACALSANVCVAISDAPEPQPNEVLDCIDGEQRSCGSKVGACAYGVETCSGNAWGPCVGAIEAVLEVCNGIDDDCDGIVPPGELGGDVLNIDVCIGECAQCNDGDPCTQNDRCSAGVCDGAPKDCSAVADTCNDGVCNAVTGICEQVDNGSCACTSGVDVDFDGFDDCDDCNDNDGSVFPGAAERCNGEDDNCDGSVDEIFDGDGDGYSTCEPVPSLRDCDDGNDAIHPFGTEDCGIDGTGNLLDDNCNGYTDEGCDPCDLVDDDGDGFSECQGDCDDIEAGVNPGATEICDGFDTDCNALTVDNCGVSDPCGHPPDTDECRDDLLCACILAPNNQCNGNFRCTSFCNSSETGALGDTCAANEVCGLDILYSINVHGCAGITSDPGPGVGGTPCSNDADCRSNRCVQLFIGPGQKRYCVDFCGSDAYCTDANATCRLDRRSINLDGICWPSDRVGIGSDVLGTTCTSDGACDHGLCTTDGAERYCTEPCCTESECPGGYTCSLFGDRVSPLVVIIPADADTCGADIDCPTGMMCFIQDNLCAWRTAETAPMCLRDVSGQDTRQGGAACTANSDCRSNFCDVSLGVCIEPCCNDTTCPAGLTCELQTIRIVPDRIASGRVCMNTSIAEMLVPY